MSYAIDVRCLKGMYKQYGALPVFVRDKNGIEKPGKFCPLHSFVEGYYWHVMTIDDLDEEDKKCTIVGGPNDGKCPYPRGYKQDTPPNRLPPSSTVADSTFAVPPYAKSPLTKRRIFSAPVMLPP